MCSLYIYILYLTHWLYCISTLPHCFIPLRIDTADVTCYIPELNTQRQDVNFYSPRILWNSISLYQYTQHANRNKHVFLLDMQYNMEAEAGEDEDSLIIILQKR